MSDNSWAVESLDVRTKDLDWLEGRAKRPGNRCSESQLPAKLIAFLGKYASVFRIVTLLLWMPMIYCDAMFGSHDSVALGWVNAFWKPAEEESNIAVLMEENCMYACWLLRWCFNSHSEAPVSGEEY